MIQYIYEGEYDPALPDNSVSDAASAATTILTGGERKKSSDGESKKVATPSASFPHTCFDDDYGYCSNPSVCAHHYCGSECEFDCNNYRCEDCHIESLALAISGSSEQLLVHAKLYEITDKYDVMGLKDLVAEKFKRACQCFWNEPVFGRGGSPCFLHYSRFRQGSARYCVGNYCGTYDRAREEARGGGSAHRVQWVGRRFAQDEDGGRLEVIDSTIGTRG
jgi:hypothetical protein